MKRISYKLNIIQDAIAGLLGHKKELHTARFAHTSELKSLISPTFDEENSLLIGKDKFGHVLRICPSLSRRELGNVLIEAPTRGGKGLLATSQLLSWKGSVIVNDIK
jgi:type IV secretory pathway TraG/TraD family ATPase VirD4